MFNLLISGAGWPLSHGSMHRTRLFEHTEDHIKARFTEANEANINALLELPALFASERGSLAGPARVGRLIRAKVGGGNYEIDYTFDEAIPPIPTVTLETMARQLGISEWEMNRTHWAVKDVDLFEVLLRNGLGTRVKTKAFNLVEEREQDLVAVMMPFDAAFKPTFEALQHAAAEAEMRCVRADDIWINDQVIQDVVALICKARVVICDLTGRNENVFYEMGIAHALGKDVIMITQSPSDVPFDVQHIRYLKYLPNSEGRAALSQDVSRRLSTLTA